MKKIVFTIVARNYIGLANVLAESILKVNNDIDLYIFIADEYDSSINIDTERIKYIVANKNLNISEENWIDLAFKYNVTEFCTSIKPACFLYLLNLFDDETKIIYFDPDILVFNSLEPIYNELNNNFLVLTPHITTIEIDYTGDVIETDFLRSGPYNLGFLALKKTKESYEFINWWHKRLLKYCYIDKFDSLFYDQNWTVFLSCFYEKGILISRDLGRNVAPWNFYERKIIKQNEKFYVQNRIGGGQDAELIFVHFSGFDYKNLSGKKTKNIPSFNLEKYPDVDILFDFYDKELLKLRNTDFLTIKYSYNFFSNGNSISLFHRRIYRRLTENGLKIQNPFNVESEFYKNLKKQNLVLDLSMDKSNENDVGNFTRKLTIINSFFRILKSIIGFKRYYFLALFFVRYFRFENQTFLYNKAYKKDSFKK